MNNLWIAPMILLAVVWACILYISINDNREYKIVEIKREYILKKEVVGDTVILKIPLKEYKLDM